MFCRVPADITTLVVVIVVDDVVEVVVVVRIVVVVVADETVEGAVDVFGTVVGGIIFRVVLVKLVLVAVKVALCLVDVTDAPLQFNSQKIIFNYSIIIIKTK